MPRIRRLKNYDYEFDQSAYEESSGASAYEGYEAESESSKSWLSNANVVHSFTDAQLKSAIQRYKILLSALEKELAARCINAKFQFNPDGSVVTKKGRKYKRVYTQTAGTEVRSDRKSGAAKRSPEAKLKEFIKRTGIKDADALLSAWQQILNPEGRD